jgi:hypothetical protein
MKIIPAGAIRAMFIASCPAPLGIRWYGTPSRRQAASMAATTAGSIGTGVSEASVSTATRVPSARRNAFAAILTAAAVSG